MKGINIQFDNLLALLEKNISDKDLLKNRDSFDLVYEKITQEALKTVSLIFDNLLEDFSIKISFSKLTKELKSFLSLKPLTQQQDEDDEFDRQFDQVKQFMNNRKPVIAEVDHSQRGDIVKFLFQAENKEKDIEEFMGNMNKFNAIKDAGKRFRSTKKVDIKTEDIEVQTLLGMGYFERLEKKMPGLFKVDEGIMKTGIWQQNGQGEGADGCQDKEGNNANSDMFDIDAQIQQLVKQKIQQQATKAAQAAKQAKQAKQVAQKEKQKQKQKTKIQAQQAKKKKSPHQPQSKQRISQVSTNPKRSSVPTSSQFKTKGNLAANKKQTNVVQEENKEKLQNQAKGNSKDIQGQSGQNNSNKNFNDRLQTLQNNIPSFQQMFQTLSALEGIQGITPEQFKNIYETIKNSMTQNLLKSPIFVKPEVDNKQCNTNMMFTSEGFVDETGGMIDWDMYWEKENEGKQGKGFNRDKKNNAKKRKVKGENGYEIDESDEEYDENDPSGKQKRSRIKGAKGDNGAKQSNPIDVLMEQDQIIKSRRTSLNQENLPRSNLPSISQNINGWDDGTNPASILAKQGKSAEQFLKKIKDTKYLKPMYNSKTKENYTLDMYKSKNDMKNNRSQENLNLPTLGRNANNTKYGTSLHQNLLDKAKSPYLKRESKKNIKHASSSDQLFMPDASQNPFRKPHKSNAHQTSKQEQRIMKQLQRIAKQGAAKNHIRHIAMYIQFIESVHVRRCEEKCIHLERFYEFLQKHNLPNRRELLLHKADMNVSVEL